MLETSEFLAKLKAWQSALKQAKESTELESKLRDEVFKEAFPVEAKKQDSKGTFYEDLPNGWRLQAITKLTAKLDESAVPAIKEKLLEMKVIGVDTLFKYKPSLVAAEYKKLTVESKAIVDEAIKETPAKVTIELLPPAVVDIET